MKLFLLGAGKPAHGDKPSALKQISSSTTVLDWKIQSVQSVVDLHNIYFLGGYHVEEVVKKYPDLNFSIIPEWENKSILDTFLSAPLSNSEAIISYSDTIFHKQVIEHLLSVKADVVFAYDSLWKSRYSTRTVEDINKAEIIHVNNQEVEFTGLIYFSHKATNQIASLKVSDIGKNLIDLISCMEQSNLTIQSVDVKAGWAEFNSPDDIARFILGTKADTLDRLKPVVKKSYIGRQICFTANDWLSQSSQIIQNIQYTFSNQKLVIRSSSKSEDSWDSSNAGGFESILDVDSTDRKAVSEAVEQVILSYGHLNNGDDQVLIQEFLTDVEISGVVFTCGLESGSPYYQINFDDVSRTTESVTAGNNSDLRTLVVCKLKSDLLEYKEPKLVPVLEAVKELETLLGFDKLDIEFAIDRNNRVHIFQVRPITVNHSEYDLDEESIKNNLENTCLTYLRQQKPSPFLYGNKTVLANMSDWNPAEIIGTRPRPLAFSLYRHIITNEIWAQQRAEYGYTDIRPCPLIISLSGQPYVDTRASFNSFIPRDISEELKSKLVNAYTEILINKPQLHDKIEFDIAFTIWYPGFYHKARERLKDYNISGKEIEQLEEALKNITRAALHRLEADISPVTLLESRRRKILESSLSSLDKAFLLLEDCKHYGTLAFSHAARAGFVATNFINSLVESNILTLERKHELFMSVQTIASEFEKSKYNFQTGKLSLEQLIDKYGHLRPGTYEIRTKAYWEDPEKYLIPEKKVKLKKDTKFILTENETRQIWRIIEELESTTTPEELFDYFKKSIQAREFVKFEFTKNLSTALDYIVEFGVEQKISRDELSYMEFSDLEKVKLNIFSIRKLKENIQQRKKGFMLTEAIKLPSVIRNESDLYCFEQEASQPNFITTKHIDAVLCQLEENKPINIQGKIVMVEQADPGYDWLFGYGIVGLVTKYGGANSHMAIRAAEIGLPAAIGVGEKMYEKLTYMNRVELNCCQRVIREIV